MIYGRLLLGNVHLSVYGERTVMYASMLLNDSGTGAFACLCVYVRVRVCSEERGANGASR